MTAKRNFEDPPLRAGRRAARPSETPWPARLSRRERQAVEILLTEGEATAARVRDLMADAPSYSAVRALLRVLEEKGVVKHASDGPRYVFRVAGSRERERRSALRHILESLFGGSREALVAALLDPAEADISDDEMRRLERLIRRAKNSER